MTFYFVDSMKYLAMAQGFLDLIKDMDRLSPKRNWIELCLTTMAWTYF